MDSIKWSNTSKIMKFTKWSDTTGITLEELEERLINTNNDREISKKYKNWTIKKQFDTNKEDTFNGKRIKYNLYTFSVECISDIDIKEESPMIKTGYLIIYEINGIIKYIVDKNSDAMTLIRKLMVYNGRGEVEENNVLFESDEFVWLISKFYRDENVFEGGNDFLGDVTINIIRGFKGGTEDFLTTITTQGESVMNIISTLSFIIESKNLNQINIELSYKNHTNINLILNTKKTIGILINRYAGELLEENTNYEIIAKIMIILYTEIIPIIKQSYENDIEANLWNNDKFIEFLQEVRQDLEKKIDSRVNELRLRNLELKKIIET